MEYNELYVIPSSKITRKGDLKFKDGTTANIWQGYETSCIYITDWAMFVAADGSFEIGDYIINVYDNDSHKKLPLASKSKIHGKCKCDLDAFEKEYRRVFPKLCNKPTYAFGRKSSGIPYSGNRWGGTYFVK